MDDIQCPLMGAGVVNCRRLFRNFENLILLKPPICQFFPVVIESVRATSRVGIRNGYGFFVLDAAIRKKSYIYFLRVLRRVFQYPPNINAINPKAMIQPQVEFCDNAADKGVVPEGVPEEVPVVSPAVTDGVHSGGLILIGEGSVPGGSHVYAHGSISTSAGQGSVFCPGLS